MFTSRITRNAAAVVTGSGSGIGREFALEIAARGGRVACSDLYLEAAQDTADTIRLEGGQACALPCDVTLLADVEALADAAEDWLDEPANLVINNAGVGAGGHRIGDTPIEDWRWVIDVNLWGVIHGCHVFAPRLRALDRGGMINVGSTASFAAAPTMGPYNASKAAALAITETLAGEMVGTKIHVTALCPTFVQTNITRDGRINESSSKLANNLMRWTGVPARGVACNALDGLDKGHLYVLPQLNARTIWRVKRYLPSGYTRGLGWLNRLAGTGA